jgi:hypothetical protein
MVCLLALQITRGGPSKRASEWVSACVYKVIYILYTCSGAVGRPGFGWCVCVWSAREFYPTPLYMVGRLGCVPRSLLGGVRAARQMKAPKEICRTSIFYTPEIVSFYYISPVLHDIHKQRTRVCVCVWFGRRRITQLLCVFTGVLYINVVCDGKHLQ